MNVLLYWDQAEDRHMAYSGSYTQSRPQYKRGVASILMTQCHDQLNSWTGKHLFMEVS